MTTINTGDLVTAAQINQWAPPGFIGDFAGPVAQLPAGWLVCDGSAISRTTYASLFAAIGTQHGVGDGSTTFNLPDGRGRVAVGFSPSGGHADVSTLGATDGVAAANRRAKHRHTAHAHTSGIRTDGPQGVGGSSVQGVGVASNSTLGTSSVDGGSGNANDSLDAPAYIVLMKIIRAKDV